jgi:hypothetical protein
MLIHPTAERLRGLGLSAMAEAFTELLGAPEAAELSRADWLGLLVDREATSRENKRLARRLREARLRQAAVIEDTDFRTPRDLAAARGEGRLPRMLAALERVRLLIIDDWGPEPLTAEQRRDLLEIVDDRYDKGSLLITSQVPLNRWHDVVGDLTIGDAIVDRVIHRAHRIELKGGSLRKRRGTNDGVTDEPAG